ncbi:unconventional myosin-XVB-like [Phyllobates terribilis]|uniref:unconventional myosin-XVB-like n=1 Tax=Phyllobates terribilis TaxID=111132 RepID=UPI003CCB231D
MTQKSSTKGHAKSPNYGEQKAYGASACEKTIFDFLTVLESFGNAKTVLNCNSTRCGQILQMFFQRGSLVGCSVTQYLLEKSRVVFQALAERGFHIFYEMLDGLSENEKQRLLLQEPETYYYLNQGRACDLPGKNDKMDFMMVEKCLRGIGLSNIELTSIWTVLSAILQLGNICFTSFHMHIPFIHTYLLDTEAQKENIEYWNFYKLDRGGIYIFIAGARGEFGAPYKYDSFSSSANSSLMYLGHLSQ